MARTERSASASVVEWLETEMRIAACPFQVVPPSQHLPCSCTREMTERVRSSESPIRTSTWLRTTLLSTRTPGAIESCSAVGGGRKAFENRDRIATSFWQGPAQVTQQRVATQANPDVPTRQLAKPRDRKLVGPLQHIRISHWVFLPGGACCPPVPFLTTSADHAVLGSHRKEREARD